MTRRTFLLSLILAFLSIFYVQAEILDFAPARGKDPKVKYVFLFIGDGMGQAQVNLTQGYLSAMDGQIGLKPLTFTRFPEVGFASTYAQTRLITCSAAAGTALATGHKTGIDRISVDSSATISLISIASSAKEKGFKVGILTSVSIDHATPAVFYAHEPNRKMYFSIGKNLTQSNFDYFAGGGFEIPDSIIDGKPANLIDRAKQNGFHVVNTRDDFEKLVPGAGKTIVLSPRTASESSLPFYLDMDPEDITLAEYTAKAIEMLTNKDGFFMMVEGGKIDWACHANDAAALIQEVIVFDQAVSKAYEFYLKHPDETLIVVSADHETGGLSLGNYGMHYESYLELFKYQKSSVEELNNIAGQLRDNRADGPEEEFHRVMKVIENEIGLNSRAHNTVLTEEEITKFRKIFNENVYGDGAEGGSVGDYKPLMRAALDLLAQKAGIAWGSDAHTFVNVPVYAIGPGSRKFSGYIDNTDIPRLIGEMMGIESR